MAPKSGLQSLPDRLVQLLQAPEMGTTFFPIKVTALHLDGARVVVLPDEEHYDGAVVAIPAYAAMPLLVPLLATGGVPGAGADDDAVGSQHGLAPSCFASVAIVTVGLRGGELPVPPGHSGALVAPGGDLVMTACSFGSNKWPHWAAAGTEVLRVSVGKAGDERWAAMSDEGLVDRVLEELAVVLGGRGAKAPTPLAGGWRVSRWPASLPQYPVGHLDHVAALRGLLRQAAPRVALAGASFGRVGVPACIASGRQAGAALAGVLQGQAEPAA
jgi:oxygen-dependent protoporphyrinogen oxidase